MSFVRLPNHVIVVYSFKLLLVLTAIYKIASSFKRNVFSITRNTIRQLFKFVETLSAPYTLKCCIKIIVRAKLLWYQGGILSLIPEPLDLLRDT